MSINEIPFYKMSGSGNDFILIDNRQSPVSLNNLSDFAARVCRRRMSVGADGLILLEASDSADFKSGQDPDDRSRGAFHGRASGHRA
jgi:diaminopimelate epimerase